MHITFRTLYLLLIVCSISACSASKTKNTSAAAEKTFEQFWQTFRDHYAFFEEKAISWDSMYQRYKPRIHPKMKQPELVQLMGEMVTPLRDGHITISKEDEVLYKGKSPSLFREYFGATEPSFWANCDSLLQAAGFNKPVGVGPVVKGVHLYYSATDGQHAYIRFSRCFGTIESLFDDQKEAADLALMEHLWDSLLLVHQQAKTLTIDVRGNGGGHGGRELAGRFITKPLVTHYKATRLPGSYGHTSAPEPQELQPRGKASFTKPVLLLTSDRTASSAEDFVLGLYLLPQVTTIGTHTAGMMSDMYGIDLPGGLSVTLSNERYTDTKHRLLEGSGVLPKQEVVFRKDDPLNGKDPVLEHALALARKM